MSVPALNSASKPRYYFREMRAVETNPLSRTARDIIQNSDSNKVDNSKTVHPLKTKSVKKSPQSSPNIPKFDLERLSFSPPTSPRMSSPLALKLKTINLNYGFDKEHPLSHIPANEISNLFISLMGQRDFLTFNGQLKNPPVSEEKRDELQGQECLKWMLEILEPQNKENHAEFLTLIFDGASINEIRAKIKTLPILQALTINCYAHADAALRKSLFPEMFHTLYFLPKLYYSVQNPTHYEVSLSGGNAYVVRHTKLYSILKSNLNENIRVDEVLGSMKICWEIKGNLYSRKPPTACLYGKELTFDPKASEDFKKTTLHKLQL